MIVVLSAPDPVASRVSEKWGTPPATDDRVDGAPLRSLGEGILVLRRPGPHIHDERLDLRLPAALVEGRPTLVFPSIHRSSENVACLTVHPLGNVGPEAEVGGRPRHLAPTDPRRMAATLRLLQESGSAFGLPATYEATHHGPELELPAYFVEIGFGREDEPPPDAVEAVASAIRSARPDPRDRVAIAVGGGHYAPHFTELTLERRWAFGHILSRHALDSIDAETARAAVVRTPGAEGFLFARAKDVDHPAFRGLGERRRDSEAELRTPTVPVSPGDSGTSGT